MKNRQRGRNGKQRPPGRNPNFGGGGDQRPRGNAQQLMEKYLSLARDATSAGDRVQAENYFQHADHYYRVLNARFEQQNGQRRFNEGGQPHQGQDHQNYQQDRGFDPNQQQRGPEHHHQGQQDYQPQGQQYQPQGQQYQPQSYQQQQPVPPAPETEIGLPPGILGVAPAPRPPEPAMAEGAPGYDGGEREEGGGGGRQHHQGGRRRRGRGDRPYQGQGPGE